MTALIEMVRTHHTEGLRQGLIVALHAARINTADGCLTSQEVVTIIRHAMPDANTGQIMAQLAVLVMEGKATQVNTSHYRIAP